MRCSALMRVVKRAVVLSARFFLSSNAGRAERNGVERSRARSGCAVGPLKRSSPNDTVD
jgi:hypothetical protein